MLPTLADGDRLLVRWGALPRVGRLAVVRLPDANDGPRPIAVKRVVYRDHDGWWVQRDNPTDGVDSWQVGALADDAMLALVVGRLWPRPACALPSPPE